MDRLKSKASQFFKNGPSQDEKAANAPTDHGDEFNAGIEGRLRKKPSLFFRRGHDKALPAPPAGAVVSQEAPPLTPKHDVGGEVAAEIGDAILSPFTETEKPLSVTTANQEAPDTFGAERKDKPADLVLRKRPSFASLRKSSSRIFRTNTNNHGPPPPLMPQIPVDTPTLKPRRPVIRPLDSVRSARSSRSSSGRIVSISRPTSSTQIVQLPSTFNPSKVPFNKPSGPPPPRPARPESLDDELIILMRDGSARMILHTPSRARALTVSTSSSARSRAPTRVESDDPYTRLGLPSGHSSLSSPRSPIFDFPLAAKFPLDPSRPLPFRDSSGSIKGYGRFSAYIKAREQYSSGGYNDGVEREDRELGPIEQYRESKCGDWTLERRVSGKLGERGTLFRARSGGWHFVADI